MMKMMKIFKNENGNLEFYEMKKFVIIVFEMKNIHNLIL